jgi:hypothetical protein
MSHGIIHQVGTVLKVLFARLRFLAVFLAAGFIVGYWDNIKNHWDKWTRPTVAPDSLVASAASSIEYYCAMHPNIVRNEPGNCPICSMPLIKRKKGEQVKLPEDVLARVARLAGDRDGRGAGVRALFPRGDRTVLSQGELWEHRARGGWHGVPAVDVRPESPSVAMDVLRNDFEVAPV